MLHFYMSRAVPRPRSKASRNAWSRQRFCADCGKNETVRRDNSGLRCRKCSSRRAGLIGGAIKAARPKATARCVTCGLVFQTTRTQNERSKRRFCSHACQRGDRVTRVCKECGAGFETLASTISGKTNATANFCRRPCYENWLCRTNPDPSRGPGWRAIRREARRLNPFCAYCGATTALQVHHVIPYRLTADNGQDNLIPLCIKHHKVVETAFLEIEREVANDLGTAKARLGMELRIRQTETRSRLTAAA